MYRIVSQALVPCLSVSLVPGSQIIQGVEPRGGPRGGHGQAQAKRKLSAHSVRSAGLKNAILLLLMRGPGADNKTLKNLKKKNGVDTISSPWLAYLGSQSGQQKIEKPV